MNRSSMRDMLERQLQDDSNQVFSVANLNEYLNYGLQFMQTEVLRHDPEAFQEIAVASMISTGDFPELYARPTGCLNVLKVELQYSSDSSYSTATKRYNYQLDAFVAGNTTTSDYHWAIKGRWLRIYPVPTAASTDGIRLTFVPTLTMGADADVPDLHLHLHKGIVYAARMDALGDTDEDIDPQTLDTLTKKISIILERIPLYYSSSHGEPDVIDPDVDHTDGWV